MPHHRKTRRLVPKLLDWYQAHARDLPWRHTSDPYAIWVSEVMLQQTQVTTVIAYWERWMRVLPTLQKLARAKPERILKLWEGLGYYSRARNLQTAAQRIMAEHGGVFPNEPEKISKLPGVGRYTAGAISSIAFGRPEPIVDGNIVRILTRIFGIRQNPEDKKTREKLWELAQLLVSATKNCSSINQSLMELGAMVCHRGHPECGNCPVARSCTAKREKITHLIPAKGKPTQYEEKKIEVYVLARNGKMLLQQRPEGFTNAGFWELPNNETGPDLDLPKHAQAIATVRHNITRYRIRLNAYALRPKDREPKGKWCNSSDLIKLPITASHRKLIKTLAR